MTVIVGIFDNAANLDRAVETLSERGFDDTVFDQNIVSQEAFTGAGTPYVPVQTSVLPGILPDSHSNPPSMARSEVIQAFRDHLADYHLPDQWIDSYTIHFEHGGKVVIVKVAKERAAEVMDIFKAFDAAQVHRHD